MLKQTLGGQKSYENAVKQKVRRRDIVRRRLAGSIQIQWRQKFEYLAHVLTQAGIMCCNIYFYVLLIRLSGPHWTYSELSSRYSQLIGILHLMVKLGHINIHHEVSVLSQYLALPQTGHLEAIYHIFAYLNKHDKLSIIFDPVDPYFTPDVFREVDWSEFLWGHCQRTTTQDAQAFQQSGKYHLFC
jgi:hypothetical protein